MRVWARASLLTAAVVATCLGLGGCVQGGTGRTGGAAPVVLRIGTHENADTPSGRVVSHLAERVTALSGGAVTAKAVFGVAADVVDRDDQAAAQRFLDGAVDVALVPARAWDVLGVTGLDALQTPTLVDSDALARAVAADDDLTADLMAGLSDLGVVGLALVPEDLRRVFSFGAPIDEPRDLVGAHVAVRGSLATERMFAALGAHASDAGNLTARAAWIAAGRLQAMESSFTWYLNAPAVTSVLANVVLFPRLDVIAIRSSRLAALSATVQRAVRAAAREATGWAASHLTPDQEALARYCASGDPFEVADDAQLAAFHAALAEVDVATGPHAAQLVARLRALKARVEPHGPPALPTACSHAPTPSPPVPRPAAPAGPAQALPEGTWRQDVPAAVLVAAGANEQYAQDNSGPWTLTIADGRIDWHDGCLGTAGVDGDRIVLTLDADCPTMTDPGRILFSARWHTDGRTLRFLDIEPGSGKPSERTMYRVQFGSQPWHRVG